MTVDPAVVSNSVMAQQESCLKLLRLQIIGAVTACDDLPTLRMILAVFSADPETRTLRRMFWG